MKSHPRKGARATQPWVSARVPPGAGGQPVGAFPQNSTFRSQGEPVRKVHAVSRRPQDVQTLPAHEDGRPAGSPSGPGRRTDHRLPAPRPRPWRTFGTEVVRSHAGVATAMSSLRAAPPSALLPASAWTEKLLL